MGLCRRWCWCELWCGCAWRRRFEVPWAWAGACAVCCGAVAGWQLAVPLLVVRVPVLELVPARVAVGVGVSVSVSVPVLELVPARRCAVERVRVPVQAVLELEPLRRCALLSVIVSVLELGGRVAVPLSVSAPVLELVPARR